MVYFEKWSVIDQIFKKEKYNMKKTKFIKAAAATAACSVTMVTMSGCQAYNMHKMLTETPSEYVSLARQNSKDAMSNGLFSDELKLAQKALEKGSIVLDVDTEKLDFSSETAIDSDTRQASQLFTFENDSGDSAKIYFYADENLLKVGTDGKSGQNVYDISFDTAVEKLASSIFAPNSGSMYSLDEESYQSLADAFANLSSAVSSAKDSAESNNDYQSIIKDYMSSHSPEVHEKAEADINGTSTTANVVVYNIPTDDVKNILKQYAELLSSNPASDFHDTDVKKEFNSTVNEIEKCDIRVVHCVNNKTHALMKTEIVVDAGMDGETAEAKLIITYGVDPAVSGQKAVLTIKSGENTAEFAAESVKSETSSSIWVNMTENGTTEQLVNITLNKNDNAYNILLEIPAEEMSLTIDGKVEKSLTSANITVENIKFKSGDEEQSLPVNASVKVDQEGKVTILDSKGSLFDITEDDVNNLVVNIQNDFSPIFGSADVPDTSFGGYDDDLGFNYDSSEYDSYTYSPDDGGYSNWNPDTNQESSYSGTDDYGFYDDWSWSSESSSNDENSDAADNSGDSDATDNADYYDNNDEDDDIRGFSF